MRPSDDVARARRGNHPADLPPGQRENLAGRADLDRALRHAGQRRKRRELPPSSNDMFPHLVADDDQVMVARNCRDRLQLVASNSRPAGLCGLLNMIARVFGVIAASMPSRSIRHRAAGAPPRPASRQPAGSSAHSCHRRREDDHFVAGLDRRQDRRAERFGRAAGNAHMVGGESCPKWRL